MIYAYYSSQDFSFILTVSSIVQMLGFSLVFIKVVGTRSASGISRNSIICFLVCLGSRLMAILTNDGYLPNDSTGDFIYRFAELVSFVLAVLILYYISKKYQSQSSLEQDSIKWYYFVAPTLLLALLFHPSLDNFWLADVAWTFALYLEAVSMFPQLYLFRKRGGEIESFTSHYVAFSGISRFIQLIFWFVCYQELNVVDYQTFSLLPHHVGYIVLLAQIVQITLQGDYLFYYLRSLKQGIPFTLPISYEI